MERCLGCMNEYDDVYDICPYCGYVKGTAEKSKNHLSPGTVLIDRYLIGRCLGQGGFGITYIAWDQRLYKKVAIKEFMPTSLASRITGQTEITCYNDEAQERFQYGIRRMLEESRRLARFNDLESVVKVYDCFEANQTAYIIMELLDGENIKMILARQKTIDLKQTAAIILPVLQALHVIHASGLIHRDISPDNIFVCKNGKVKLLDFGSARVASGSDDKSLSVILKPGYAPQEQYSASAVQGPFTDVYAVCATIYKMLTGVTPIDSLERRVQDDKLAPIDTLTAMPRHLARIIEQGLAVEAKDRLQTVDPLLDALQSIADDETAPAPKKHQKAPKTLKKPKGKKNNPAAKKGARIALVAVLACAAAAAAVFGGLKAWRSAEVKRPTTAIVDPVADSREYTAAQQELLQKASEKHIPDSALPTAAQLENIRGLYVDSMVYSTDAGTLWADYTDEAGQLRVHEHRILPENTTDDSTLYIYRDDGQTESVTRFLAGERIASAERYFYNEDGSLFAKSTYTGNDLTTLQIFTAYDSEKRPLTATLQYPDAAEEYISYIYNEKAEIETRTSADGKTVYERTRYLDDNEVKEVWYTGGKESRQITRKVDETGRPAEYLETEYGRQTQRSKWDYNEKSGRLEKNALYNKNDVQQSAVLFKYQKGKLHFIITEQGAGIKDVQLDPDGGYFRYAFDARGNMTLRREYAADGKQLSRITFAYDAKDRMIRKEFYDAEDKLTEYYADYEYNGTDDQTEFAFTKYDANDKKQYTLSCWKTADNESVKAYTEYDGQGRDVHYLQTINGVSSFEDLTKYLPDGGREETHLTYDAETGILTEKQVCRYGKNDLRQLEELYAGDGNGGEHLYKKTVYDGAGEAIEVYLYQDGTLTDQYKVENSILGKRIHHSDGSGRNNDWNGWSEDWEYSV